MKNTGLIMGLLGLAAGGLLIATVAKADGGDDDPGGTIVKEGEAQSQSGQIFAYRVITSFPGAPQTAKYLGQYMLAGFGEEQWPAETIVLEGDNAAELEQALKDAISQIA